MKTLIVEDDFTCRILLQEILKNYGPCHVAVNGKEAVEVVKKTLENGEPYDLICMDIMMPEMDGQEALRRIRDLEYAQGTLSSEGTKVVMTTALKDAKNIMTAYSGLCDGYLAKPIVKADIQGELVRLGFLPPPEQGS